MSGEIAAKNLRMGWDDITKGEVKMKSEKVFEATSRNDSAIYALNEMKRFHRSCHKVLVSDWRISVK